MRRKDRKLTKWHQEQVVSLDWVAGTLARSVSQKKSLGNATDYEDLKQVALWGVCAAVYDWDPEGGKTISSYAWDRASAYIGHYMRDKSRMIKIPRKMQKLYYSICEIVNTNPGIKESQVIKKLKDEEDISCSLEEFRDAKRVGLSTPFQLFAETLDPELEEYQSSTKSKSSVLDYIASFLSDADFELCSRYFDGTLKKKAGIIHAEELIGEIRRELSARGFTIDELEDE